MSASERTIMMMPSRRNSPEATRARRALMATAARVPNSTIYFLDGTSGLVIEGEVESCDTRESRVEVIRRNVGDGGFKAVLQMKVDPGDRVLMFHDDDRWSGTPLVDVPSQASVIVPRIPVFDGSRAPTQASLISTQHVMFGAIRGDLFIGYKDYLRVHPEPSGALDWAIRALVLANGPIDAFANYTYDYRIDGWQDQAQASSANAVVLSEAGWDFSDPALLASLVVMFDSLSLMTTYASSMGRSPAESTVLRELYGPPFRGRRLRRLIRSAAAAPFDVDVAARKAMARWIARRYLSGPYATVDSQRFPTLHRWGTTKRTTSIQEVVGHLLPQLSSELPESVRPQLVFWRETLGSIATCGPGHR